MSQSCYAYSLSSSINGGSSNQREPLPASRNDLMHSRKLFAQSSYPGGRNTIRAAALFKWQRLYPAAPLQTCQRSVKSPRLQTCATELFDILHHRVSMP